MSVTVTSPISAGYIPNGVTTAFPFDFKIGSPDEIAVYQVLNGVASLVPEGFYSASIATDGEGGTVTYHSAPATGTGTIYILSDPLFTQTAAFSSSGNFNPASLSDVMDRAAIRDLRLAFDIGRTIKVPIGESVIDYPPKGTRAGKTFVWDADGNPAVTTSGSGDAALRADLALPTGATLIGYEGPEGAARSLAAKLADTPNVRDYGAIGDGVTDDTDAVQAMFNALGFIHFTAGIYKLVAKPDSPYTYGNSATAGGPVAPVYRAVDINGSNVSITGDGNAVIKFIGHEDTAFVETNYAFATAKNMTLGAITNLRIRGLRFDFDPTGDLGSNKRSFSITGCQGVFIDDCWFTSSGDRAGATITLQNCETVRISRLRFKNTTQGMNLSYVSDVEIDDLQFDNFNEAMDFDRVVRNFHVKNLSFVGRGTSDQAFDLNSVQNGDVDGIYAEGCGNIFLINYKSTTQETFAEYVNTDPVAAFTPSKNVTVSKVYGINVGSTTSRAISLGIDRVADYTGGASCDNLIVRDVYLDGCGYCYVEDVTNFLLENWLMKNSIGVASTSFAALGFEADATYSDAHVSGTLRNISIVNCGRKAIRVQTPEKLVLDNVNIDGFNVDNVLNYGNAIELAYLNNRQAEIHISRCSVRNGNNSPNGFVFSEGGSGTFKTRVFWGEGNKIDVATVPTPISFGTDGIQKRIMKHIVVPIGDLTLAAGQTMQFGTLYFTDGRGARVAWVTVQATAALAAAADSISYETRSVISGTETAVSNGSFVAAGIAKATETDLGVAYNEAACGLRAGDLFYLHFAAAGAGATIKGLVANIYYLDFITAF